MKPLDILKTNTLNILTKAATIISLGGVGIFTTNLYMKNDNFIQEFIQKCEILPINNFEEISPAILNPNGVPLGKYFFMSLNNQANNIIEKNNGQTHLKQEPTSKIVMN